MEPLNINIQGTQSEIEALNEQLRKDLVIYSTRPFLNRLERCDMQEYFSTWGINKIIALFNFDRDGNYLPNVYQAPTEYLRMLYPIDDIINFERQGTLIIDREQYSPELRKLSYFIYMVDEDLYEQYKSSQNFLGKTAPTFMFDMNNTNGVRIFKDYFALARHLRKQRLITYCLGPRTAFYLRYFIHQVHVHTTNNEYAFGTKEDPTLVNKVVEGIKRHLAFNTCEELEYNVDITVDNYKQFRLLATNYKMNLPKIEEFKNNTTIKRYSKQNLRSKTVYRLKTNKIEKYKEQGIMPWNHMVISDNFAFFYIWDSRIITKVLPIKITETPVEIDGEVKMTKQIEIIGANFNDFTSNVVDNGFDLVCKANAESDIREAAEQSKLQLPIQFRDTPATIEDKAIVDAATETINK